MIVLREFKLLQKFVGLDRQSGFEKIIVRIIYLVALFSADLAFTIFFVSNIHDNFHVSFTALPDIIGYTLLTANYLHLLASREQFDSLLDELQAIVDERMTKYTNETIYVRAEELASITTKVFVGTILLIPTVSISPFALAAYHWCLGKYTLDSWIFFFPVWTPFDLNSTFRCALLALYGVFINTTGDTLLVTTPCLLIVFMLYLKAFVKDIKTMFNQMNSLSKSQKPKRSEHHYIELEMFRRCKEIVDLHKKVNRLLNNLAYVMNFFVLETIVLWAICICAALFVIEEYDGSQMVYDLQMPFLAAIFPLILLAILFNLGQDYNGALMNLSDAIYQSEWYQYSSCMQRFVLLIMMRSQRSFFLSAYGIMELRNENFVALIKWMVSGMMVLRSMN